MTISVERKSFILSLDIGTQNIKAAIFDSKGNLHGLTKVALSQAVSNQPGWVEQPVEEVWQTLKEAVQRLWEAYPNLNLSVNALTLTAQRGSIVLSNNKGEPLHNCILWLDQRKSNPQQNLPFFKALALKVMRASPALCQYEASIFANWLHQEESVLWSEVRHYELLSGYLTRRLTGLKIDSVGHQVGYLPFDFKRQSWAKTRNWRWLISPIKRSMLSELVPPGTIIGTLNDHSAKLLGLAKDTLFITAAADKACETLGCGGMQLSTGCLSLGTTATLNLSTDRYHEIHPLMPALPSAVPNHYNLEWMLYRGFWLVSWFIQHFCEEEQRLAKIASVRPETLLDNKAKEIPPGSLGLTLLPYWSPGRPEPGPEAKGAIIGFGGIHQKAHLYRALLEGMMYGLKFGLEHLQKHTQVKVSELTASGGGSNSDLALQIASDVMGLPVHRPSVIEASALGAAINAAVGLGYHKHYPQALAEMTKNSVTFYPNPQRQELYQRLFQEVFKPLYPNLKPLYQSIQKLTGYPA